MWQTDIIGHSCLLADDLLSMASGCVLVCSWGPLAGLLRDPADAHGKPMEAAEP